MMSRYVALLFVVLAASTALPSLADATHPSIAGGERLSNAGESDFPALAATESGPWCAWIAFDGKEDRIRLARHANGRWQTCGDLPQARGQIQQVALAACGPNHLLAVWAQQRRGNWDLYWSVRLGTHWSKPAILTSNPEPDLSPRLATGKAGQVWLVWQAFEGAYSHIRLASWSAGHWSMPLLISEDSIHHWAPAIAVSPGGAVYMAWDAGTAGDYDIYLRCLSDGRLSPTRRITDSPVYEANPTLTCEANGRVWIAYDCGEAQWGRGANAVYLHQQRTLGLRCLEGERLSAPPLPNIGKASPGVFAECPRLATNGDGRIWLVYRRLVDGDGWEMAAQCWNGHWSSPQLLPESIGRSDMAAALAATPTALWMAWASDGRKGQSLSHAVFATPLPNVTAAAAVAPFATVPMPAVKRLARTPRYRSIATFQREPYTLYYGDLHRHTELAACHPTRHGSLLDTFRYALDVAHLDFIALTDPAPGADAGSLYRWHLRQKTAMMFNIGGCLAAFCGYECPTPDGKLGAMLGTALSLPATWRVGSTPDAPLAILYAAAPTDAAACPGLVAPFEAVQCTVAPAEASQPIDNDNMSQWLPSGAHAALVAGSGHGNPVTLTHLWAGYLTGEAILNALRQRRTAIGPETVALRFTVNGLAMGAVVTAGPEPPLLHASVTAEEPLQSLEILCEGTVVKEVALNEAREGEITWLAEVPQKKEQAYIARARTISGAILWTTPIWLAPGADQQP